MTEILDAATIDRLKAIAKDLPVPIRPDVADDGRPFYGFIMQREWIIQRLLYMPPGWTYRAVTYGRGSVALFEPVPIEGMEPLKGPASLFMEPQYI